MREIDDHAIGAGRPGPFTRALQDAFQDALHGRDERYLEWLDVVAVPERAERMAPALFRGTQRELRGAAA